MERLTLRNFDRITGLCALFRFAGGTGLPAHETGSAATEAYLRRDRDGRRLFDGREIGQYRAALVASSEHLPTLWPQGAAPRAALAQPRHDVGHGARAAPTTRRSPYDEHLRAAAEEARPRPRPAARRAGRLARWASPGCASQLPRGPRRSRVLEAHAEPSPSASASPCSTTSTSAAAAA